MRFTCLCNLSSFALVQLRATNVFISHLMCCESNVAYSPQLHQEYLDDTEQRWQFQPSEKRTKNLLHVHFPAHVSPFSSHYSIIIQQDAMYFLTANIGDQSLLYVQVQVKVKHVATPNSKAMETIRSNCMVCKF